MENSKSLNRFKKAQAGSYYSALKEISSGKKKSCWMWYIFPQIEGMGYSETSKYYAIKDRKEAEDYMADPILSYRLKEISSLLLTVKTDDPVEVFGEIDAEKLKSSMTLFWLTNHEPVFDLVLQKFFNGDHCRYTATKLGV